MRTVGGGVEGGEWRQRCAGGGEGGKRRQRQAEVQAGRQMCICRQQRTVSDTSSPGLRTPTPAPVSVLTRDLRA